MNILIIGGNRFFGKKLAHILLNEGHDLTLLNRGNVDDGLGSKVTRIRCDRTDKLALSQALEGLSWDLVYDQVCYDYQTACDACEVFAGKTPRYIYTSSQSVYLPGRDLKESDFDPTIHKFDKEETQFSNYAEAKRQAEVGFSKFAPFSMTLVRFPIVIGDDDYTGRFAFHVEHIRDGKEIFFPNIRAQISFVTSDFAAKALAALAKVDSEGPLNVASPSPIRLSRFINIIEESVGKKIKLALQPDESNHSPYGIESDWFMNCDRLKDLGIVASEIEEWLPTLL